MGMTQQHQAYGDIGKGTTLGSIGPVDDSLGSFGWQGELFIGGMHLLIPARVRVDMVAFVGMRLSFDLHCSIV